jgi:hypothetical protein
VLHGDLTAQIAMAAEVVTKYIITDMYAKAIR